MSNLVLIYYDDVRKNTAENLQVSRMTGILKHQNCKERVITLCNKKKSSLSEFFGAKSFVVTQKHCPSGWFG